jgi:hypothetical protein
VAAGNFLAKASFTGAGTFSGGTVWVYPRKTNRNHANDNKIVFFNSYDLKVKIKISLWRVFVLIL